MGIESALKNIGDWISKETESRKYPKNELLELSESLQALKAEIARQSVKSEDNWKELREDFMHNLRGCDTVTVSLNGVGSTDYSTEDIYNMIASLTDNQVVAKSATSEEVQGAIDQVEGTRRKAQKELDSLIETKSRYDHQIEIGDPWNWKWEESWNPLAVEGRKQTIKNANLAITALQAYRPKPDCESAERCGDKCCGYGKSDFDDEPIDVCKDCEKQASYGED